MNSAINLLGSLRSPGFPICVHRQSNAYVSFCPFVYKVAFSRKPSKYKSFFQNSFILDKKSLKNKRFLFKTDFYYNITSNSRNASLQHQLVSCICQMRQVCVSGSDRIKKLIWESEETNNQFASLGSVCIVKISDLLRQHFQDLFHSFLLHGPPSQQMTYI